MRSGLCSLSGKWLFVGRKSITIVVYGAPWCPLPQGEMRMVICMMIWCHPTLIFLFLFPFSFILNLMINIKKINVSSYFMTFHIWYLMSWFLSFTRSPLIKILFFDFFIVSIILIFIFFNFGSHSFDLDSYVNLILVFNFTFQFKVWWYLRLDPQCFHLKSWFLILLKNLKICFQYYL